LVSTNSPSFDSSSQTSEDGRILAEYAEVLARPKFEVDPRTARAIVERIRRNGIAVLPAPLAVRLPDPDGIPSAEVSQAADVPLVTGNLKHFPKFERAIGVAEFLLALAD
jgi:hypothetical protein